MKSRSPFSALRKRVSNQTYATITHEFYVNDNQVRGRIKRLFQTELASPGGLQTGVTKQLHEVAGAKCRLDGSPANRTWSLSIIDPSEYFVMCYYHNKIFPRFEFEASEAAGPESFEDATRLIRAFATRALIVAPADMLERAWIVAEQVGLTVFTLEQDDARREAFLQHKNLSELLRATIQHAPRSLSRGL